MSIDINIKLSKDYGTVQWDEERKPLGKKPRREVLTPIGKIVAWVLAVTMYWAIMEVVTHHL
jgi:hypothetical protein